MPATTSVHDTHTERGFVTAILRGGRLQGSPAPGPVQVWLSSYYNDDGHHHPNRMVTTTEEIAQDIIEGATYDLIVTRDNRLTAIVDEPPSPEVWCSREYPCCGDAWEPCGCGCHA